MFTTVSSQLATTTLRRLIDHLSSHGRNGDVSEAINTALEFWLDAQSQLPPGANPSCIRGYQWKSLFLPEGTVLRSWSYGEHNYARVEGDKIIHQGEAVSPNQFARAFARSTRNARFDIWVRRPGEKFFKMAALLRKELAQQPSPATLTVPTANAVPPATAPSIQPQAEIYPGQTAPGRTVPVHKSDFEPGWDLPERRKFRCRLEDVAF